MRNVIIAVVVLFAVLVGVYYYQHTSTEKAMENGETISPDKSVTTDKSVSTSLAPAPDPTPAPVARRSAINTVSAASVDTTSAPTTDTIDRNPPNGMVFAGTGHIQVYRQGNITWRINTDNGEACVLFATDREWRKPRVYQRGCANS